MSHSTSGVSSTSKLTNDVRTHQINLLVPEIQGVFEVKIQKFVKITKFKGEMVVQDLKRLLRKSFYFFLKLQILKKKKIHD